MPTTYSPSKAIQVIEVIMGKYVDRGDPAAPDFTEATLLPDATWYELDLSAIVPEAGANHLVHLSVEAVKYEEGEKISEVVFKAREPGNVNEWNLAMADKIICTDLWIMLDANRKIEYWLGAITMGIGEMSVTVRGWIED